jgi:sulfopyruvate decarboxylase TPP-binding subunit
VNLYYDEGVLDEGMLDWLRETQTKPIVGMGKAVQKVLEKYNIPHIKIVHPAARGKYKRYEIYVQHLRERLRLP